MDETAKWPAMPAPCMPSQETTLPALGAPYGHAPTSAELLAAAEVAQYHEAAGVARKALQDTLNQHQELACAGVALISAVRTLRVYQGTVTPLRELARFRKELQPKANELGCKIVLVGDRTAATLVLL